MSRERAVDFVAMPLTLYAGHGAVGDVDADPVDMDELLNDIRCGYVSYNCSDEHAEIQPKGLPKIRKKRGRIYRVEPPRMHTIVLLSPSRAHGLGIDVPSPPSASSPSDLAPIWADPPENPPTYAPTAHYAMGAWLTHPKFGAGVVFLVERSKVRVLFESGERVLVHAAR
jgi:hypothetical protein